MITGLVRGGHFDGKVFEIDRNYLYLPEKIEEPKLINASSEKIKDDKRKMVVYEKYWYQKDNERWYEWRLKV